MRTGLRFRRNAASATRRWSPIRSIAGMVLLVAGVLGLVSGPAIAAPANDRDETREVAQEADTPGGDRNDLSPQSGDEDSQVIEEIPAVDALTLPLEFSFTVTGGSVYSVSFPLPAGLKPVAFRASLEGTVSTELRVTTPLRSVGIVPTTQSKISLALEPRDLDAQGRVVLRFALPPGTWCDVDGTEDGFGYAVTISDAEIDLVGTAQPPSSVGDFFGPETLETTVDIPKGSEEILAEASLNMVSAATVATGGKPVHLTVGGYAPSPVVSPDAPAPLDLPTFSKRRVELVAAESDVTASIKVGEGGIPTLVLTGEPEQLASAANAFAQQGIQAAAGDEVDRISSGQSATSSKDLTHPNTLTFSELGATEVYLEGYGRQDEFVSIAQGSFGRSVRGMEVTVNGTVSATDMTVGTVQFLWNSEMVDSFVLDPAEPTFSRTFTVTQPALHSGNYFVMRLQAVSADNKCIDESLLPPVRVDLSTDTSTVTVKGDAIKQPSFQAFPQSFGVETPVGFGEEISGGQLSATAELVAALQRATPRAMALKVVPADTLIGGKVAGILVSPTEAQAAKFGTSIYFTDPMLINDRIAEVTVGMREPYAALQAVRHKNHPVLILASNPGTIDGNEDQVLMTVVSGLPDTSWWQLENDLRIATQDNVPVLLDTNPARDPDGVPIFLLWLAGGSVVALLILGFTVSTMRARKKAAERSDEDLTPDACGF